MTCAGVMLACALLGSSTVTRWAAWPRGPHACPIFQQKTCTLGTRTHAHRLHARCSARMFDCCALPAAACECWPAEPHLMPQPPVIAKSCSNPRAHKAEVHYQRGTLVESRPCWQVVPLPSPAFPPTSPDEHHPDPESLCQSSLFPFPRFFQHSLSPCTPALRLPLYKPWQIMPRSLQSTSATLSAFMLAHLPLFR